MDWHLRIVWWLVLGMLLVSTSTLVEARYPAGGGGRSGAGHRNNNTYKPSSERYGGKLKMPPETKIQGPQQHTNNSGHQNEPTGDIWKPSAQKGKGPPKTTETPPITTTHRHWHAHGIRHQNHTKDTNSKDSKPRSPTSEVTQQPSAHTKSLPTKQNAAGSYNRSWYDSSLKAMPMASVEHTTSSGGRNKSVETVTGKGYQHLSAVAAPNITTNNRWYGYSHKNGTNTDPKHKNPTSSHGVWPTIAPTVPRNATTNKNSPSTQQPNIYTPSAVTKKNSTSSHNSSPRVQPPLPTHRPGSTNSKTQPPRTTPGHTTPAYTPRQENPVKNPPTYPGSGGKHVSSGPQWAPPGYVPIYSMMPGFNITLRSKGGLGYSKNFCNPSSPTVFILQIPHYHYPSSIPSKGTRRCDCYVKGLTAACISKLKDKRVPSCVNSSVTAIFIKSKEVNELSIDAFSKVKHLKYINITDTKLNLLPRDFFRDTKKLLHLVVQKNPKLKSLHCDVFRDAYKLEDVILDQNSIISLDQDVFTNLTNVKRLNLGYNKIRTLPKGIFRGNRQLQELRLSGNSLYISSDSARDLLKNNAKLRVLLMRNCELDNLPIGLLKDASNLEWLDLSRNNISRFPVEFIQDCTKLGYLRLSYNKLTVLSSDVLHQHGGSLSTLRLEGNPWRCDCNLLPLASWATLRNESVPVRPRCSSPHSIKNKPLPRWLHSRDAAMCANAISSLRTDLNRVLSVAHAIAKEGPNVSTNVLKVSDKEVRFIATNYFSYGMAARTDSDVGSIVWHCARFLEGILDRRHLHYMDAKAKVCNNSMTSSSPMPTPTRMGPLATTTAKPLADRGLQLSLRPKRFELLMNFTKIMKNIPENITKVVDDGIEEELKFLFGIMKGTSTTGPSATAATAMALNSTGFSMTITNASGVPMALMNLNATELVASLCSELREVLSILLQSIDRANWDAAYQKYEEDKEKKVISKSPPKASSDSSAESYGLIQPHLTVYVAFFTLLAHTLV